LIGFVTVTFEIVTGFDKVVAVGAALLSWR
jgi:hypothetical protein